MKTSRIFAWVLATLIAFCPAIGFSKGSHGGSYSSASHSSGGAVHVNGYTKKDGTYVAPHYRSAPNGTKADNWSTKGNVNPYTGKEGTKNVDTASTAAPTGSEQPVAPQPAPPAAPTMMKGLAKGMTKAQVTAALGQPNIETPSRWYYSGKGYVVFANDRVSTAGN